MQIQTLKISEIKNYEKNPRKNQAAVNGVAESIRQFGFKQPIVIDKNNIIIAGHTRLAAARKLKLDNVPCVVAEELTETQVQAYRLLDNKLAEKSDWDIELLEGELQDLKDFDFVPFEVFWQSLADFLPIDINEDDDRLDKEQLCRCPSCEHVFNAKQNKV